MPKTSSAVAQACAKIEIDPGCEGSWADISGTGNVVTLPEEVVTTGSVPVFGDDTHVLGTGKKEPVEVEVSIVYTEEADEAFEEVRAVWIEEGCNKQMCVRATPAGGSVGDLQIILGTADDPAYLSALKPPDLDAGSGDPAVAMFRVWGNYSYDTITS